eukprot:COSAG01_NODE_3670_length_5810_cov_30.694099_1_plen_301_part_10
MVYERMVGLARNGGGVMVMSRAAARLLRMSAGLGLVGRRRVAPVRRVCSGSASNSGAGGLVAAVPAEEMPPLVSSAPPRAVLGVIQIPTDYVMEKEGASLLELFPGVEMSLQKMAFTSDKLDEDTFALAADNITAAAATLLPSTRASVLGVACTSLSFTLGPEHIDRQLRAASPHAATTDMARAQAAALRALGARRVSLLTPYIPSLADANARMLEATPATRGGGFVRVVRRATMGLECDELTSAVGRETLRRWALAVDCEEAEVVVVGCSAFRAAERGFIDELELELRKPVVTSTQACVR